MLFAGSGFDNDAVMKEFLSTGNWLLQLTFSVHKWLSEGLSSLWMYWKEE